MRNLKIYMEIRNTMTLKMIINDKNDSNKKLCIFYVNMEILIITKTSLQKIYCSFCIAKRFYRMV